MKIAFDAKRLYNNFTGLGNYSRNVVSSLAAAYPDTKLLLYTPGVRKTEQTLPFLSHPQMQTLLPAGSIRGSLWRTCALAGDLQRDGVDLYHGLSHEIPMGLSTRHIPSIVTMHDVAFHTFPVMYHWYDRKIYDLKFSYACRHADHIVAISESTRRDVMRFYGVESERISVIYQPVQTLFYTPMDIETARTLATTALPTLPQEFILYVGSINSRKNLLSIVRALEVLPPDRRPLLLIVGNGREYKTEVERYAATHHLESALLWATGIRDNLTLQALYTLAKIFVYPSFYEGFGLPVVEAALNRCPVITSNVSSLPEAGGPGALCIDPTSAEDLAEAIAQVLDSPTRQADMATAGEAYARQMFAPQKLAEQLMQIYRQTLDSKN